MRQIALWIIIAAGATALSFGIHKTDIVGRWINIDDPSIGFHFEKDGFVKTVEGDKEFGGDNFERDGKIVQMKYILDETKTPAWIDFVIIDKATGKELNDRMMGLLNSIDNNKIEVVFGFDGSRPKAIDKTSEDYAVFKRIE